MTIEQSGGVILSLFVFRVEKCVFRAKKSRKRNFCTILYKKMVLHMSVGDVVRA